MSYNAADYSHFQHGGDESPFFSPHEKHEIATYLDGYLKQLSGKYNSLPVTTDTLGKKKRKLELEALMDEVQGYIYMMRRDQNIRRDNFPPRGSLFRDCYDAEMMGSSSGGAAATGGSYKSSNQHALDDPKGYVFW